MTISADPVQDIAIDEATHEGKSLSLNVTLGRATFKARGDAAAVLGAFGSFQEFYAAQDATVDEGEPVEEFSGDGSAQQETTLPSAERNAGDSVPLSVFLAKKKLPRGNAIIALGIAVWARRYKGEEVFTADTMKAFWRDSKKKVPSNIPRDLGSAASEGWLERLATGAGNYGLTSYGEAHFDALPEADD